MHSRTLLAGLSVALFALGAGAADDPTDPRLKAVQEQANPGSQFTDEQSGSVEGKVKGALGNVITLDVGRKVPLVQLVVKKVSEVKLVRAGKEGPLDFTQLPVGTSIRAQFRNDGGIRVVTSIEVL